MSTKTLEITKLAAGINEMLSMPVGHRFTIIKRRTREGVEICTEYRKINATHVEIVRNFENS